MPNVVIEYLQSTNPEHINTNFLAYLTNLQTINSISTKVTAAIVKELADQRNNLKLIASENYSSIATQVTMGNLFTDKYAEGYPMHRNYAGCDNVDEIESYAAEIACRVFNCDHAYIQPHSGADANLIAFWAILNSRIEIPHLEQLGETNPSKLTYEQWSEMRKKLGNQRLLGLDYYSGGHLTHGYRHNVSAQMFDAYTYSVNKETGLLDYDEIEKLAKEIKPLILLTGYSAYPRHIDFQRMREIADKVNAVFMVDMAHFAGLVAGKAFTGKNNPIPYAHVVTTTTHKTLRGPRGGMVLCTKEFSESVDKGCPLVIGGPLPHVMASKAIALLEADTDEFCEYAKKIIKNANTFARACMDKGMTITTQGTDNHLFLIDVRNYNLTGRQAESVLRECGITLNRNSIPFDPNGPWYTSGLRIGTPAITTLGMGEKEILEIAEIMDLVLKNTQPAKITKGSQAGSNSKARYIINPKIANQAKERVNNLIKDFPIYPELDLNLLQKYFSA